MGQQQLLLLILSVLIVGVAIAVGITIYNTSSVKSNKDALMADVNNISANAYSYFTKARIMGGGGGTYDGFDVSADTKSNDNGDIIWTVRNGGKAISFVATSRNGFGTVAATMDDRGQLSNFTFTGEF